MSSLSPCTAHHSDCTQSQHHCVALMNGKLSAYVSACHVSEVVALEALVKVTPAYVSVHILDLELCSHRGVKHFVLGCSRKKISLTTCFWQP